MRSHSILGTLRTATLLLAATAMGCAMSDSEVETPDDSDAAAAQTAEVAPPAAVASVDRDEGAANEAVIATPTPAQPEVAGDAEPEETVVAPPAEPEPAAAAPTAKADSATRTALPRSVAPKRSGKRKHALGGAMGQGKGGMIAKRPMPPGKPAPEMNTEGYDHIAENGFIAVADDPRSTFSIDVDTASYANVRRFIEGGSLPPADAVRIEELVNYFSYDYDAPIGRPFSVDAEAGACPWNENNMLVSIGLQGETIDMSEAPARNLVFLLDVSGSMSSPDKLPLLKRGLSLLVDNMRNDDRVSIVVYAGASGVVLNPTKGTNKDKIIDALDNLQAGGSTNGGAGIELAYKLAEQTFIEDGINRVILATDGDFNVGVSSRGDLVRLIENKRKSGVFLSVLGFGTGNVKDSTMEQLADKGNGNYAYIDSILEAKKVLVEEAGGTLVTIAKDVKLQVEFNPKEVASYRLIGYENRKLAHSDFNDDTKDAGEIGAGHSVTALYEVVPASGTKSGGKVDGLKYQEDSSLSAAAASGELMTVKVRYKDPKGSKSKLITHPVTAEDKGWDEASKDFRFAAAVAEFGLMLRDSKHKGDASYRQAIELAEGAIGKDPHGHRRAFVKLARDANRLSRGQSGSVAIAK
jgi:Ca-activated chloride channel family protein